MDCLFLHRLALFGIAFRALNCSVCVAASDPVAPFATTEWHHIQLFFLRFALAAQLASSHAELASSLVASREPASLIVSLPLSNHRLRMVEQSHPCLRVQIVDVGRLGIKCCCLKLELDLGFEERIHRYPHRNFQKRPLFESS